MSDVIEQPIDERRNMPSASAFPRYDLCKGSFQMEQEARRLGQVAHIGGKDADRGTKIHAWLAGESVELEPDTLADAEALKARADEQEDRIFGEGTARNVLVERRLWFNTKKSSLSVSCRFDRTVYNDNTALTINFKTGWREPEQVSGHNALSSNSLRSPSGSSRLSSPGVSSATFTTGSLICWSNWNGLTPRSHRTQTRATIVRHY